jgi:hypothetical protein
MTLLPRKSIGDTDSDTAKVSPDSIAIDSDNRYYHPCQLDKRLTGYSKQMFIFTHLLHSYVGNQSPKIVIDRGTKNRVLYPLL